MVKWADTVAQPLAGNFFLFSLSEGNRNKSKSQRNGIDRGRKIVIPGLFVEYTRYRSTDISNIKQDKFEQGTTREVPRCGRPAYVRNRCAVKNVADIEQPFFSFPELSAADIRAIDDSGARG